MKIVHDQGATKEILLYKMSATSENVRFEEIRREAAKIFKGVFPDIFAN